MMFAESLILQTDLFACNRFLELKTKGPVPEIYRVTGCNFAISRAESGLRRVDGISSES